MNADMFIFIASYSYLTGELRAEVCVGSVVAQLMADLQDTRRQARTANSWTNLVTNMCGVHGATADVVGPLNTTVCEKKTGKP